MVSCNSDKSFPSRPITLICPWSAGGGTDRVARQVAVQLKQKLGVPVNVVNATGGGGVTGHTRGAVARPDGYTLTLGTVELNMLHHRGLAAVGPDDFLPLGLLNEDSAAIFVLNNAPWKSLADLEAAITTSENPLKASGTASGGIWHVALIGWLSKQSLPTDKVTWISINGSAPSLQELLAGGVDMVSCSVSEAKALMDAGEVRCLGVMSGKRLQAAPDVPTFAEQGIDWQLGSWRGLLYPKGVAPDRLARMQEAVQSVSLSEEFTQFMNSAGFNISLAGPDRFGEFLKTTDGQFEKTLSTPAFAEANKPVIGPWVFPGVVGASILVVIALSFRSFCKTDTEKLRPMPVIVVVTSVLGFLWLSPIAGYLLATGALLLGLMLVLRAPRWTAVAVTVVAAPLLYQIFAVALGVPLPWGWLGW